MSEGQAPEVWTPHWHEMLSERDEKEVNFATLYRQSFHHGTAGHNQYMLIAFLADALNRAEQSGLNINELFFPKGDPENDQGI